MLHKKLETTIGAKDLKKKKGKERVDTIENYQKHVVEGPKRLSRRKSFIVVTKSTNLEGKQKNSWKHNKWNRREVAEVKSRG